jgi:hypothetical protein
MSKADQGYKAAKQGRGGYGRGVSRSTYLAQSRKGALADLYLRTQQRGLIDLLGLDHDSEQAMTIKQGQLEEFNEAKMTKGEIDAATQAESAGLQATAGAARETRLLEAAAVLIDALQSRTRSRDRQDLEQGDLIDDAAMLMVDGSGWGEEVANGAQYRKHVNIAIDNSGSTHMPETGFCSIDMQHVARSLIEILYAAAGQFPGVTWDAYTFNRVARQHTGHYGRAYRAEIARQALSGFVVDDPLTRDARETNLAPLVEAFARNEAKRGFIGSPRLDIILTDGDWESQADTDLAADWQAQRGANVSTYVINLCPDNETDVALPHQFRVIPLHAIITPDDPGRGWVDRDALRTTIMEVVRQEVERQD